MASTPRTDAPGHGEVHRHGHNPEVAHEHSDISVRGVMVFVAVLVTTGVVVHVAMWLLFMGLNRYEASNDPFVTPLASSVEKDPTRFPQPLLQTTPWTDLRQFRAEEDAHLHSYGWIDQKNGIARLPIDKAKDLLLQRGLPARQGQANPNEGTHLAAFGEANGGTAIPAGGADLSTPKPPSPPTPAPGAAQPAPQPPKGPGGDL